MQFNLERTTAKFGVFNPRKEKNVGPACDLPFTIVVPADILLMLAPAQVASDDEEPPHEDDTKDRIIQELFSVEGYVKRPALSPLSIHRKPEGVTVEIWDQEDLGDPLMLTPCRFSGLSVELQSPHQVVLKGKIQYSDYNNNELIRISSIMDESHDIAWRIEQIDLFESADGKSEDDTTDAESEAS